MPRQRTHWKELLFVLSITLCVALEGEAASAVVALEGGTVRGANASGVRVFRGIPYAAPPVDSLRWRAPRPYPKWEGIRDALEFGAACMQPKRKARPLRLEQSEDCLTLNVWAPEESGEKKPVMVWIHGGAFRFGSGSQSFYDGTELAKKGVILVTFNYRLGRFGFFAHPEITRERQTDYPAELLANYGLMDQLFLLRWVQNNIAAFGGDPGRVTIFGESAGGVSVNYLVASPLTEGLFHRAIAQSGGGFQVAGHVERPRGKRPSLASLGEQWVRSLNIKKATPDVLRKVPAASLLKNTSTRGLGYGPVIDGALVVDDLGRRFAQGLVQPVAYMSGANSFEASLMRTTGMSPTQVFDFFGDDIKIARKIYGRPEGKDDEPFAYQLYGDGLFAAPARHLVSNVAINGQPAWLYYFSYVRKAVRHRVPGAPHASEIPFVFGSQDKIRRLTGRIHPSDIEMSNRMMSYWVSFAINGNPNGKGRPVWPQYKAGRPLTMEFGNSGLVVRDNLYHQRLDFHQRRFQLLKR